MYIYRPISPLLTPLPSFIHVDPTDPLIVNPHLFCESNPHPTAPQPEEGDFIRESAACSKKKKFHPGCHQCSSRVYQSILCRPSSASTASSTSPLLLLLTLIPLSWHLPSLLRPLHFLLSLLTPLLASVQFPSVRPTRMRQECHSGKTSTVCRAPCPLGTALHFCGRGSSLPRSVSLHMTSH